MMKTSVQEAYDAAQGNRKAYEQHFEIGDYLSKFEKWNDMVASLAPHTPQQTELSPPSGQFQPRSSRPGS